MSSLPQPACPFSLFNSIVGKQFFSFQQVVSMFLYRPSQNGEFFSEELTTAIQVSFVPIISHLSSCQVTLVHSKHPKHLQYLPKSYKLFQGCITYRLFQTDLHFTMSPARKLDQTKSTHLPPPTSFHTCNFSKTFLPTMFLNFKSKLRDTMS